MIDKPGINDIQQVRVCSKWSLGNVYGYDAWKGKIVGLGAPSNKTYLIL